LWTGWGQDGESHHIDGGASFATRLDFVLPMWA
jgi:hypothetical protein